MGSDGSDINYELLGELPSGIRPWLSTELVVELWLGISNEANVESYARSSRRRVHQSSIHCSVNQRPGGAMGQRVSSGLELIVITHPIVTKESLEPETKLGVALNPTRSGFSYVHEKSM